MFLQKLYVRIWLAVVSALLVLSILLGWSWRMFAEKPLRELIIRNAEGEVVGRGNTRRPLPKKPSTQDSKGAKLMEMPQLGPRGRFGHGPEFIVQMRSGESVFVHLPRPRPEWDQAPFGFLGFLGFLALAVALGIYPIVRKLTRRLEVLQLGVDKWGQGDLSMRFVEDGRDEIAFLAKRFNHAAEQIEVLVRSHQQLLESQKSLLANASHELRSPLTRIRMGLELMDASSSSAKLEMARNISELDQLIEEILLASRLDSKQADLGTIQAIDLIGMAAEECARVAAQLDVIPWAKGAQDHVINVQGVTKLIRRMLRNLLENARRYSDGQVQVRLERLEYQVEIRVFDRGPGIPVELQGRIFEPFYRLPGATERDGGVGLGLALVKAIASRHQGRVYCENRTDGGACFVVLLPLASE